MQDQASAMVFAPARARRGCVGYIRKTASTERTSGGAKQTLTSLPDCALDGIVENPDEQEASLLSEGCPILAS